MTLALLLQSAADTLVPLVDSSVTAAQRLAEARAGLDTPIAERLIGLLGIATMVGLAVLLSYDRKRIPWRLVGVGLALQFVFGLLVLKSGPGRAFFDWVGGLVTGLLAFQEQGARFVFGNLVQSTVPVGPPLPAGGAVTATRSPGVSPEATAVTSSLRYATRTYRGSMPRGVTT